MTAELKEQFIPALKKEKEELEFKVKYLTKEKAQLTKEKAEITK